MTKEEAISTLANFKRYISGGGVTDLKANEALDMAIEALQADTVEVVRCKECIHHDDFFMGAEGSLLCWKGGTDKAVSAMGYCECGERSEDE